MIMDDINANIDNACSHFDFYEIGIITDIVLRAELERAPANRLPEIIYYLIGLSEKIHQRIDDILSPPEE